MSQYIEPLQDFSDGLAVLKAYHERMLGCCEALRTLARQAETETWQEGFDVLAAGVVGFLSVATALHHRDEERALFPELVDAPGLMALMVERLEEDHDELERLWARLEPLLSEPGSIAGTPGFARRARRFAQLLQWHIEREDENFFPEVEKALTGGQRRRIGAAMAQLRDEAA
jgi:hemerythrin-like domain-containing protein